MGDIKTITLRKDEKPILIQVWLYGKGAGSIKILTDKREENIKIEVRLEAFLDFIREQTINRS